jgi:hypothetical protein
MNDDDNIGAEMAEHEAIIWERFDSLRHWQLVQGRLRCDNANPEDRLATELAESVKYLAWYDANVPSGPRVSRPAQAQPVPDTHTGSRPFWGE